MRDGLRRHDPGGRIGAISARSSRARGCGSFEKALLKILVSRRRALGGHGLGHQIGTFAIEELGHGDLDVPLRPLKQRAGGVCVLIGDLNVLLKSLLLAGGQLAVAVGHDEAAASAVGELM